MNIKEVFTSFKFKIALAVFGLIFGAGSVITYILLDDQETMLRDAKVEGVIKILDIIVQNNSENFALAVKFDDLEAESNVETAADNFSEDADVLFVYVVLGEKIITLPDEVDKEAVANIVMSSKSKGVDDQYLLNKNHLVLLKQESKLKSKTFGTYYVGMSIEGIKTEISKLRNRALMIILFLSLAGLGIAGVVTKVGFKPIQRITTFAELLGAGNVGEQMEIRRDDEFGLLGKTLNSMSLHIKESQNKLAEQEQLKKEMAIAQEIQRTFLPDENLEITNINFSSYFKSAKAVGGDGYDYFKLKNGNFVFMVFDVAGKGIEGAIGMAITVALTRSAVARGLTDPMKILSIANDGFKVTMPDSMYVVIALVHYNPKNEKFTLYNCGVDNTPIFKFGNGRIENLTGDELGAPIGLRFSDEWRETIEPIEFTLDTDEKVFLYSDGVTETFNADETEVYGEDRLLTFLEDQESGQPSSIVQNLVTTLNTFSGVREEQDDDLTLMVIAKE